MKYVQFLALAILAMLFSCTGDSSETNKKTTDKAPMIQAQNAIPPNTLSDDEKADEWSLLFDGKSMSAWRGYNKIAFPKVGWDIRNQELWVIKSGTEEEGLGGDIITKALYDNFDFKFDFMLSDTANSGIFYLAPEQKGVRIYENAPEFQVLDNKTYLSMEKNGELGDFKMEKHMTGDNYDLESAAGQYARPVGKWNTGRITVNNRKVEHYLNDKLCVSYVIGSQKWKDQVAKSKFKDNPMYGMTKKGHIGIQDHGHTVRYRNLKIKKLN